jgi:hypothetical protein
MKNKGVKKKSIISSFLVNKDEVKASQSLIDKSTKRSKLNSQYIYHHNHLPLEHYTTTSSLKLNGRCEPQILPRLL